MSFSEFLPPVEWRTHIAAYWVRQTSPEANPTANPHSNASPNPLGRRVYADGCADLIYNAGPTTAYYYPKALTQHAIPLLPGRLYLGGTMTAYGIVTNATLLTGIRFWPGGFYALFAQDMQPAVDTLVEFPDKKLNDIIQDPEKINQWLSELPVPQPTQFTELRKIMYDSQGNISIESLAQTIHTTNRTLERIFKKNVGIPPKEFLKIIRFQAALKHLQTNSSKQSLLNIAFDLGYYDHAHLTNEFKKYAGILPSELSHFYKTRISDGEYF